MCFVIRFVVQRDHIFILIHYIYQFIFKIARSKEGERRTIQI